MLTPQPFQLAYLRDPAKLKGAVKARRIGGSEMIGQEAALRAAGFDPVTGRWSCGVNEFLISASLRQSEQLLRVVKRHLGAIDHVQRRARAAVRACEVAGVPYSPVAVAAAGAVFRDALEVDGESLVREQRSDRIVLNVKTIKGEYAEICAFPANPDTLRGFEGNVCFDEFGQMPFSEEMWKAAYPITGPTKANAEGYRLRVVGTPNGDANMFYKLANTDDGEQISWHWIDIYRAKADGFPIDIEAARKEIGDHDAFLQEYVVTFLSSGTRYIEEDRIQSYEDRECPKGGERYAGLDVAESPVGDLSAIEVVRKVGDVYWIEPDGWADRGVRFSTQKARVSGLLQEGVRRVAIDATGVGAEPAQTLSNDYPQRVDAVKFTNDSKEGLVTRLKRLTDEGLLRYPKGALDLRRDVLLMRRISLPGGGMRYDIERSRGGRGHGDRAWALALALHAAETGFKGVGGAVRLK